MNTHTHPVPPGDRSWCLPVAVDAGGVDVIRALDSSDRLQAHTGRLEGHDVDQTVLELVAGQVGADEARRVGFRVCQSLRGRGERRGRVVFAGKGSNCVCVFAREGWDERGEERQH